tara:strand:+ start:3443 stop:3886 length:444 start_codon:yes stop_codon:yes gene_type:complete
LIAVLQRVHHSKVVVEKKIVGQIDTGLNILLGIVKDDKKNDAEFLAKKISDFRIFADKNRNMNLSIQDVNGSVLVVSQFTLCANWKKGNRPDFLNAAKPEKANELYEFFIKNMKNYGIPVYSGKFGAMMDVHILNDGPITFILDSKD